MKTLLENLSKEIQEDGSMIYKMLPSALSGMPFQENTIAITRYLAENFPVYLAVHKISPMIKAPAEYSRPHVHEDNDEINIILSEHNLSYKIQIGSNEYIGDNNSCIWIPRGMIHAANVLKGSGYFITLRIA